MISYSISPEQVSLFQMDGDEFSERLNVEKDLLLYWNKLGLLSYNIFERDSYDEPQFAEANFVKTLMESGLDLKYIIFMLSKLKTPYCYKFSSIYWDFQSNTWKVKDDFDHYVAKNINEIMENYLDEYIEENRDEIYEQYFEDYDGEEKE